MTRHVAISEFKDRASELVAAAEAGEEILITRHGKPVALLSQTIDDGCAERRAREALTRMDARRERLRAAGMTATVDEMIAWKNEGQR